MSALSPGGSAKARFLRARGLSCDEDDAFLSGADPDDFELRYLGWEIARCAPGLVPDDRDAIALLARACLVAVRAGSTRLAVDEARLTAALVPLHATNAAPALRAILVRARAARGPDPVTSAIGGPGERKPLILDGDWLYPERMLALEERFCTRIRNRLAHPVPARAAQSLSRALNAIATGPPPLTDEQKRAVREALAMPLALVTGGPGTGKTTIVVAMLRALAWLGEPMEAIAIAAPTGKAAQRLRDAISTGLASAPGDIVQAGLRTIAPVPQTLHRLLGWSPATRRFARHENDPLPFRMVLVDEASMVDLTIMDRLVRALADDARLVLLGDADQLPSIDAGAVFRDLCAALRSVHLSTNLRVGRDSSARRIVNAAQAINRGQLDAGFEESVAMRHSVDDLAFEGVEHLAAPWGEVGQLVLDRWWRLRVAPSDDFARRIAQTYRLQGNTFDDVARADLHALLDHHARSRLLCATRVRPIATSADALNAGLLQRLRGLASQGRRFQSSGLPEGAPVIVERNDYERQLFNGDQGVVVRVDSSRGDEPELTAVFRQGNELLAFPVSALPLLAPALAMTVHKAQGSEFDDVVLVLPDVDLPMMSRELVYTAMTRARRSVLFVGRADLLARAVSRTVQRYSGVAEKLRISRP